ncbi:TPA: P-loop NTPase fold protein [Streptococcus suis]|uniref:P-loop NTPase fold protein n=1 Tax=Streptococcus suis TaxID=1307 RepID=UPI00094414B8|nr:P-loop NTPase fold protein [Streptococcus suis]MCQ8273317.1 KAP family NTPase [Streptococcus suis]MDW8577686.1 P-loop NTPase fold protein [Streptococcus suis]MDW8702385.1 P-loop NTPase fold protein [Streptococcus suis]MDW8708250.1 P-loop NTPase fold protein [Streptococcus suis]MDW8755183.1 P-loop NTPase fold protein [Streptococcus suis]
MEKQTFITLEDIDTSIAAENFNRLLDENKTYFLNGSWGSGKTTFLESTESQSKKKFVTIDLWRNTDKRSLVEVAYASLHPVLYWGALLFSFLFVIISILMTNTVNLGLSKFLHPIWMLPVGFISLVVAAVQLVAIKTEIVYSWLLDNLCLKNKVLVIDDFDRLTLSQQEEAYRLFSLLRGRLPIVFVGDIENIYSVKDNFLSKIIDRRVELPFVLQSEQIWDDYFIKLEQRFATEISDSFKKRVKVEKRSLRDREHFNDYVNQEFFSRGKLGHVQVEEQLLVIYSYLFYIEYYRKLLNNETIIENKSNSSDFSEIFTKGEEIPNLLSRLQRDNTNKYPVSFKMNREGYFLYESPSNRKKAELDRILNGSEEQLSRELAYSNSGTDFYQYLSSEYKYLKVDIKEKLLSLVIQLSLKYTSSRIMDYIIQEYFNDKIPRYARNKPYSKEITTSIIDFWNTLLDDKKLDFSEKLYFLEKHYIFSFKELGEIFDNLSIDKDSIKTLKRRDFYLLTYLSSKNLWNNFSEWEDNVWYVIDEMSDHEFISFWILQGIIFNGMDYYAFDYKPADKKYTIWIKKYSFDRINEIEDYEDTVIKKIQSRLDLLEIKGYRFEKRIDERYKRDYD